MNEKEYVRTDKYPNDCFARRISTHGPACAILRVRMCSDKSRRCPFYQSCVEREFRDGKYGSADEAIHRRLNEYWRDKKRNSRRRVPITSVPTGTPNIPPAESASPTVTPRA